MSKQTLQTVTHTIKAKAVPTVARTVKVKVPDSLRSYLDKLYQPALNCARIMLKNRADNSTKFYPQIPSVISKGLIAKYQKNPKCKNITNLVLPICGDKGKQIKLCNNGVKITSVFKKAILPVVFPLPVQGYIRSVEFFKRQKQWYATLCYNTPVQCQIVPKGVIGIDRNSVGNIAVLADPQNGKVLKIGFSPAPTKRCMRGRRSNLQKAGATSLLKKIKRKQRKRMTYENHRASRTIVNYAIKHCRYIVLEDLNKVYSKNSKIKKYSESNNWACYQLQTFITYKAALNSVPIIYVNPAYTSQICSKCGNIYKPNGKKFVCKTCSHTAHRDVNSSFNIAKRGLELIGYPDGSNTGLYLNNLSGITGVNPKNVSVLRSIGGPQTGKELSLATR